MEGAEVAMREFPQIYDPPFFKSQAGLSEIRKSLLSGDDGDLYVLIGHFLVWYGNAEFILTAIIHSFTNINPVKFNIFIEKWDASKKLKVLKDLCDFDEFIISAEFNHRLKHFENKYTKIRNIVVHSQISWWPKDEVIEFCSLGAPPEFEDVKFPAPKPKKFKSRELFEGSIWLKAFTFDLAEIHENFSKDRNLYPNEWKSPAVFSSKKLSTIDK